MRVVQHLVLLAALTFTPATVAQTTWYVDDDNTPGPGTGTQKDPFLSIQDAIVASTSGDTIIVMPGRYVETINLMTKTLHLRGSDPADPVAAMSTIIDGNGSGIVVRVVGGQGPDTIIEGLTVTGGNAAGADDHGKRGAGIHNHNTSPTIRNCVLAGNAAQTWGGGIYNFNGNAVISNCTFMGNAAAEGGGIYNENSNPTITNCRFSSNTAATGAGVFNDATSSPVMAQSEVCGNTADQVSGAFTDGGGNLIGDFCPPPLPTCPGDVNRDGVVNINDLLSVLSAWGSCPF